ncbi:thiamine permease [Hornefia porci]|uniref:Thiamine permease n=1 Tax=Hornefia porci TaxID=2652292 RepID=A0A1Q9JIY9_9FIRM|nr:cytosine permease [Hornefia porci]OLR56179.1 thiamine permease [Hornefia porci]
MSNGADTKVTVAANNNDNATRRVPEDEKKGFLSIAFVAAGYCICMSGLYTGSAIAFGMTFKNALIAVVIGNIILSLYGGAIGAAGAKEGVASAMLARHSFGREGSKFIGILLAVVMLGWFAVQVGFFGSTMAALFPNAGVITQKYVAAGWGGILMMITAYFGYKGLNALSYVAVPLIAILATVGSVIAVENAGGLSTILNIAPNKPMTIGAAVVTIVGSFAGGAAAQSDITRYAKTPKTAWAGTIFGYLIANSFVILAGYIIAASTGESDLPVAFLAMGLGAAALIILILAQWTTNDNNLYTASLGLSNCLPFTKHQIVLGAGVLATLVGAMGLADYFTTWLSILGIGLPPVAGTIICDYYLLRERKYEYGPGTKYSKVNLWAFISMIGGIIVGFTVNWGIASINSLAVSIVVYYIFMKLFGEKGIGILGNEIEK